MPEEIGIDVDGFPQRVESNKYKGVVQQDVRDTTSKSVRGTPAFVVGKSIPNGVEIEVMNGTRLYSTLDKKLKKRYELSRRLRHRPSARRVLRMVPDAAR
jgi:predicted DsbA family dithiol-disulfide isomerase